MWVGCAGLPERAVAEARGVAVREVPTASGSADYVLYVDGQAVGVIEAKKAGSTLTGVEFQTRKYRTAYPDELPAFEVDGALPFGYESTGAETRFTSGLDPVAASRRSTPSIAPRRWPAGTRTMSRAAALVCVPASRTCQNSMRDPVGRTLACSG